MVLEQLCRDYLERLSTPTLEVRLAADLTPIETSHGRRVTSIVPTCVDGTPQFVAAEMTLTVGRNRTLERTSILKNPTNALSGASPLIG